MEEIKEALEKLLTVISGLQDIVKQHNKMFLDVYERIAELEREAGLKKGAGLESLYERIAKLEEQGSEVK